MLILHVFVHLHQISRNMEMLIWNFLPFKVLPRFSLYTASLSVQARSRESTPLSRSSTSPYPSFSSYPPTQHCISQVYSTEHQSPNVIPQSKALWSLSPGVKSRVLKALPSLVSPTSLPSSHLSPPCQCCSSHIGLDGPPTDQACFYLRTFALTISVWTVSQLSHACSLTSFGSQPKHLSFP